MDDVFETLSWMCYKPARFLLCWMCLNHFETLSTTCMHLCNLYDSEWFFTTLVNALECSIILHGGLQVSMNSRVLYDFKLCYTSLNHVLYLSDLFNDFQRVCNNIEQLSMVLQHCQQLSWIDLPHFLGILGLWNRNCPVGQPQTYK